MANVSQLRKQAVVSELAHPEFARELSNLCRKHGVGLGGEPFVFLLEPEDYSYNYGVVNDRLTFGYGA